MQVPSLTQPTAKASWQVDTPPSADPVQPTPKPGAGKAAAVKAAVQAPQVSTPTGSSPLPADVPDSEDAAPTGPVLMPNSTSTSANEASTGPQGVLQPRQTPAVSSRLSALKARLDSEKHRSSGDDMPSGPRYAATLLRYKYFLTVSQPARLHCNTMCQMSAMT